MEAAVRYRCRHTTRYEYGEDVPVSHHLVHLTPRPVARQRRLATELAVAPEPSVRKDYDDPFGNPVVYFAIQEPHTGLAVTATSVVEVSGAPPFDPDDTPPWEAASVHGDGVPDAADILQYAFDSVLVAGSAELAAFARESFAPGRAVGAAAVDLMRRIHADFTFDPTATTVATPLATVLETRRGVCQDFAHLLVGALRSLGLPARYVSGYLRTLPPPGQPRLVGADVSHAWASVWCGGDRWLDLCPTNNRIADQDYITLAWGRDYDDVSPVRGVIHVSAGHSLIVEVDVEPME